MEFKKVKEIPEKEVFKEECSYNLYVCYKTCVIYKSVAKTADFALLSADNYYFDFCEDDFTIKILGGFTPDSYITFWKLRYSL